jgi:hypothetical protein
MKPFQTFSDAYPQSSSFVQRWISGPPVYLSNVLSFLDSKLNMTNEDKHGILFVHLDEVNCFLQDEDGDRGIQLLTRIMRAVTQSHQSPHRLFLAAIYSATTSAKMMQAAVKSEEPQHIIDLEPLTASDYKGCLLGFLSLQFGAQEGMLIHFDGKHQINEDSALSFMGCA